MLIDTKEEKQTLLIATNDSLLAFLSSKYSQLSELYYLSIPFPSNLEICYNKRLTYKKAMELDIPIPESYFPESFSDIKDLADKIEYPYILKPSVMHVFHQVTGRKVYFCKNKKDLFKFYTMMCNIIPSNEVILQKFIEGGTNSLFSFGSFAAKGEVYGCLSAKRIRQHPMDFGNSTCFAYTVIDQEFENQAKKFLKSINYFGMSEIEFMFDNKDNSFKLLEINPRAWKWHSIANKLNINLLEMMVNFLNGKDIEYKYNKMADIGWIEHITDIYVAFKEIIKGKLTISEYLKTIRMPKENAVWLSNDPLPAFMYIFLLPYLFFIRK
ncbi:MAG: ATP-grasp domain-containing protein [Bacteroidales bacterium]|nr:ATP-grasp domain-containing protein [Bacteroidales bacterium]